MAQNHYAPNHKTAKHSENDHGLKVWDPVVLFCSYFLLPSRCPAEVCVSEQSQNAGELSLWFLWTINNTFFFLQIFLSINLLSWGPGLLKIFLFKAFPPRFSLWVFLHALVQVLDEEDELPELELPSSCHLSRLLLLAFMKKLLTVLSSNPSCWEIVICNSLDGRLFSLNIACRVRRWTSVKTNLGFLGVLPLSFPCSCSFLLHAAKKHSGC